MKSLTHEEIANICSNRTPQELLIAKYLSENDAPEWVVSEAVKHIENLYKQNQQLETDAFRYRALRAYKKSDFGFDSAESMDSLADQMVELGNPYVKQSD